MFQNIRNKAAVVATAAVATLYGAAASAQATLADVQDKVDEATTLGTAIAIGVTLMIFSFAAAKWVRRAK